MRRKVYHRVDVSKKTPEELEVYMKKITKEYNERIIREFKKSKEVLFVIDAQSKVNAPKPYTFWDWCIDMFNKMRGTVR